MKNLKKALSLVLASAMLIGMMVVGTGAAHSDVKAEHNEVAIAVVSAAGIMGAGSEFNPDGEITRGEMAVIMTNMLGLDTKEFQGASNFADAGWAADYIDACYANGVMAGISATQFGTNVKLTTAQAALMMLKALGYYEVATLPSNWDMAVVEIIRAASKDECDILNGIKAKAYGNITRNEVAQMILNTLCAEMVEETVPAGSNTTSIKGEGFEITFGNGGAVEVEGLDEYLLDNFDIDYDETAKTALGLPAVLWTTLDEDGEEVEIITATYEPKAVLTATKDTTALDLYKDKENKKFKDEIDGAKEIHAGDVVYYYAIEDSDDLAAYAVCYELIEVTKVKEATSKKLAQINGKDVAKGVEFDVEKGDWALIAKYAGKIGDVKVAEIIEGKVTSEKSNKFTIDGDKYVDLTGKVEVGAEIKAVLDNAGRIAEVIESETVVSDDIAYIYNVTMDTEKETNEDGKTSKEDVYTVYVVLADGSKEKYTVEEDSVEDVLAKQGKVVAYTLNKDDEFEIAENENLYAGEVTLDKGHKSVTIKDEDGKDKKVYADSKTEFIFADWNSKNKMIVTTATGIKNVEITEENVYMIIDDNAIVTVMVLAKDAGLTVDADTQYGFVVDAAAVKTLNDDDEYVYTYVVYVDDEEIELTFEEKQSFSKMDVIAFEMDGEYATTKDVTNELVKKTIEYIGEDFVEIDSEYYTADDAVVYVATLTIDEDGDKSYDYAEGSLEDALENKAEIEVLINEDDEIVLAFYKVTVDEREED